MKLKVFEQINQPLFADLLWDQPVTKGNQPQLVIVGGHRGSLHQPLAAYKILKNRARLKCFLPDIWSQKLPTKPELIFGPSNRAGGLAKDALEPLLTLSQQSDSLLISGSLGGNSQTKQLLQSLLEQTPTPTILAGNSWQLLPANFCYQPHQSLIVEPEQLVGFLKTRPDDDKVTDFIKNPTLVNFKNVVQSKSISGINLITSYQKLIATRLKNKLCYTYRDDVCCQRTSQRLASWSALYIATNPQRMFEALATACWSV